MRSTTIIMIVGGIIIVLLLITIIIQSGKKPGKKKSSSSTAGTSSVIQGLGLIPESSIESTVDRDSTVSSNYTPIDGVQSDSNRPSLTVTVPGLEEFESLPPAIREAYQNSYMNCGVRRWMCDTGQLSGTDCDMSDCQVPEDIVSISGEPIETSMIESASIQEAPIRLQPVSTSQVIEYDDLPIPVEYMDRSYVPNVEYLDRLYGNHDEILIVPDKFLEIDLDNMGLEYIPHRVQREFDGNYTLTYSLWPIDNQRASYTHHQPGYSNYYMDVRLTLYGDSNLIMADDILDHNYIIDPYDRSIKATRYELNDDSITLLYRIERVEDFIPIATNVATFNIVEDRYLIPMVDNIHVSESPYNYTDQIILTRNHVTKPVEYDVINGTYAIRIPT